MARSRKKTPIAGHTCAESEKDDKRRAARATRRAVNVVLGQDPEAEVLPDEKECGNPWTWEKDGKSYADPRDPKNYRK